jgi:integrase
VAKLLESIVARGAPSQANHVHRVLTTFFNCCASPVIALVPTSPMVGVERPAVEVSRERVLEDWELALIWRAAVAQGYPFGPCIQLLMLTAQRRDEVAQMTRSEVDFDKALWTLPAARSKNGKANLIPLPPRSLEILQQLPWTHELAFTTTGRTAISGFSRLKDRLDWAITNLMKQDAQAAGRDPSTVQPLAHWTYHDFRRTASSNLARLGVPLHVTEKLLNHQPQAIRGVAAIYNRYEYLDERREALERWEAQVRQITAGWDDTSRVSSGLPTALAFKPPGKRSTLR